MAILNAGDVFEMEAKYLKAGKDIYHAEKAFIVVENEIPQTIIIVERTA